MREVMQGLWIGESLSTMERLSITSFLENGHRFHLYCYDELGEVPPGAELLDASRILPRERLFRYSNGSFAGFSNCFRYRLLVENGGWWTDLDTICLRPFAFTEEYVFSSELDQGCQFIDCAVIRAPRNSAFAQFCWEACEQKKPDDLRWGETGPQLVASAVQMLGLTSFVRSAETFCPIDYRNWEQVLDPFIVHRFSDATHAIHLWHEQWRRHGRSKDGPYPRECIYEQLRARYLSCDG